MSRPAMIQDVVFVRNEITFVVNKKRFQEMDSQITLEDGTGTTGGSIQLEAGTIDQTTTSSRLETQITQSFVTLSGTDISSTDEDDKIMLENMSKKTELLIHSLH